MQKILNKRFVCWIMLYSLMAISLNAQTTKSFIKNKRISTAKKSSPASFNGGDAAYNQYINAQLKYPTQARENEIQGLVTVSFIVNENGAIEDAKIIRDIGGGSGKEVLRLVKNMPPWIPAKHNGKLVKSLVELPIKFKLDY